MQADLTARFHSLAVAMRAMHTVHSCGIIQGAAPDLTQPGLCRRQRTASCSTYIIHKTKPHLHDCEQDNEDHSQDDDDQLHDERRSHEPVLWIVLVQPCIHKLVVSILIITATWMLDQLLAPSDSSGLVDAIASADGLNPEQLRQVKGIIQHSVLDWAAVLECLSGKSWLWICGLLLETQVECTVLPA